MSPDHHAQQQARAQQQHKSYNESKKYKKLQELKERESKMNHMDIASFPTNNLLQLLAALLGKITVQNDAIRDGLVDSPSSSSSASSSLSATASYSASESVATASELVRNEEGVTSDEQMEGDDASQQPEQREEPEGSGTRTPPSQMHSHSRNPSNEPVTPAVPFSSPAMSRNASNTENNDSRKNGGNAQTEDAFEHDSRLTVSSSTNSMVKDDDKDTADQAEGGGVEEEDSSLKPRHNFYRPPTSTSKSASSPKSAANKEQQGIKPLWSNSHTILTSAAQALAMPNATLCFHARNIPSISIEAYLIRISKCEFNIRLL